MSDADLACVVAILKAHLPTSAKVYVFGSRATGKAKPWSDLDLAIDTGHPLGLGLIAKLAEAFDESALTWKVDLVDLATVSPEFRQNIETSRIALL